jgi:hypothetical protein
MPKRDQLFLLTPDFADTRHGDRLFFCPETAMVEGMLAFYPKLRARVDVHYIGFDKPRSAIVALLGEAVQGCPMLVLVEDSLAAFQARADVKVGESQGTGLHIEGHRDLPLPRRSIRCGNATSLDFGERQRKTVVTSRQMSEGQVP